MKEIVREVFFDRIAFVTKADDELRDPVGGVNLHYVPEDWLPTNEYHRLGDACGLFRYAGAVSASQDNRLHIQLLRCVV